MAKIFVTSPILTFVYPSIDSPDTTGEYADNKYKPKGRISLSTPEGQAFKQLLDDTAVDLMGRVRANSNGFKPGYSIKAFDGEDFLMFNPTTQYPPKVFNAKGVKIQDDRAGLKMQDMCGTGTKGFVKAEAKPYKDGKGVFYTFTECKITTMVKREFGGGDSFPTYDGEDSYEGGADLSDRHEVFEEPDSSAADDAARLGLA